MKKYGIAVFAMECILLILIVLLSIRAKDFFMRDTKQPTPISLTEVTAEIDGIERRVSLPYTFENLQAGTLVTITADITPGQGDVIYLKSVYATEKVYVDGRLLYELGNRDDYPSFMIDPATEVYLAELGGKEEKVTLCMEILSPKTRDTLTVHAPLIGSTKSVVLALADQMKLPFLFSVMQIMAGVLLIITSSVIAIFEKRGVIFLWLGFFSLTTGMWAFGECDLTGLFIKNPTLLYLCTFIGLFTFLQPLLYFAIHTISFQNPKPIQGIAKMMSFAVVIACILQLVGSVQMSSSMYFFHAAVPLVFCFLSGYTLREAVCFGNREAKRFLIPISVLAFSSIVELINYQFKFTWFFSSIFQIGVLFCVVFIGITGGLYIRDVIQASQKQRQLAFERDMLEQQVEEQKKHSLLLVSDAEKIRQQRHDLRHQLTVIKGLADTDCEKLKAYIATLIECIPQAQTEHCENIAVNAIVSHYDALCRERGIALETKLVVPMESKEIADSELCVIFGNLLENGVEACCRMPHQTDTYIHLKSSLRNDILTITMDNTFDGEVKEIEGRFRSRKREAYGIGISSVQSIARNHYGNARFESEGQTFLSSVYVKV